MDYKMFCEKCKIDMVYVKTTGIARVLHFKCPVCGCKMLTRMKAYKKYFKDGKRI